jgi:hypothetical protein
MLLINMNQNNSDIMNTKYLINYKPIDTNVIATEINIQYIRLIIFFCLIFIAFIFALKEYLDGLKFIQELSIIETLRSMVY